MNFLRKFVCGLATWAFGLFILIIAGNTVWATTIGRPTIVKGWLNDSGFYNQAQSTLLADALKSEGGKLPVDDPQIQKALKESLPPEYLKSLTENFVDGLYRWLQGTVPQPDFVLDLTPFRDKFIGLVGEYAKTKLKALPACNRNNLPPPEADIFSLECLPPRTNVDAKVAEWQDQIKSSGQLGNPVITAQNMHQEQGEQSPFTDQSTPKMFQTLRWASFLFAGLAVLAGFAIVKLNDDPRKAWRNIARSFLIVGLLMLVNGLVFGQTVSQLTAQIKNRQVFDLVLPLTKLAASDIARVYLIFGVVYSATSVGIYIWLKKTAKKVK